MTEVAEDQAACGHMTGMLPNGGSFGQLASSRPWHPRRGASKRSRLHELRILVARSGACCSMAITKSFVFKQSCNLLLTISRLR